MGNPVSGTRVLRAWGTFEPSALHPWEGHPEGAWEDWEDCSASCGGGERQRSRGILVPAADNGPLARKEDLCQIPRIVRQQETETGERRERETRAHRAFSFCYQKARINGTREAFSPSCHAYF